MLRILFATLLLTSTAVLGTDTTDRPVYSFGIVPQQSASKLARLWGPLLAEVSRQAGVDLRFATAPDIPSFEARLRAGEYDVAYMNPYHYTHFHDQSGYQALAKARDTRVKGILVVRKDSPITAVAELQGATLAFPAPAAFAATILTQSHLDTTGVGFTPKYVASHDSVYRAVAKGLYPAGGGVMRTLNNVAPEIRDQLRVLWTSDGYTPHAFASHPRVPDDTARRVQQALVSLQETTTGQALLAGIGMTGIESARDSDWDDVRGLRLDRLLQR